MSTGVALWLLLFAAVVAIAKSGGLTEKAFFVFAFAATFIFIPWLFYFWRGKPPSVAEKIVANVWLFIRRFVGFVGAVFFFIVATMIAFGLFDRAANLPMLTRLGFSLFLIGAAIFCVWVAIFGQGWVRADWKDDVTLHRENKKRYRWRW